MQGLNHVLAMAIQAYNAENQIFPYANRLRGLAWRSLILKNSNGLTGGGHVVFFPWGIHASTSSAPILFVQRRAPPHMASLPLTALPPAIVSLALL